ncbi:hypothetical protein KAR91_64155 [Candidatus Pacearchaeota archaeon]|nr:hypothetical protein [Candidatus Pacearchaeota archaeon]
MSTKALFITALGGSEMPVGPVKEFVRSSGDILTSAGHGLETGAGPFKVMTTNADAPSGLTVAKHAETFMTGTTMIATDVLEVAGKDYTLIATPAADGDVDVGGSDAKTLANLAAAINLDIDAGATTYDPATVSNPTVKALVTDADILTIQARTLDAAIGNAITASSVDATMVVDNATLQNGASGTDYYIIRLDDNTFSVATSKALAEAGTAVTLADAGTGVHTLVSTSDSLAEALEDVLTNVLTYTGARTMDAAFNIAKFWRAAIDGVASDRS